jgi:hypothetical protein
MNALDFLVSKDRLAETRLSATAPRPLAAGQMRLRIEKFALTANNITYAAFGKAMSYWDFYPSAEEGWGCIPVWGFATVSESLCPDIAVGERFYGYYPMSSEVILQPVPPTPAGFAEGSTHRSKLHAVYNSYSRCSADPFHAPATEDAEAILRPLFMTSWLIDDFLADNEFFGAASAGTAPTILSSASSKTAYGTAFCLAKRQGVTVIGLTSATNLDFCRSLGCYHQVLTYDQFDQLDAGRGAVYVDFAGNATLRRDIHTRLPQLRYSCAVGGTHVNQLGGAHDLPGPRPTLFFAPAQIKKRSAEWGAALLGQRLLESWQDFLGSACDARNPWLQISRHRGRQSVAEAYRLVLSGRDEPRLGRILSLQED